MIDARHLVVTLSALFLVGADRAKASPWFGVWKLRLASPSDRPETLVYSDAGKGAMRMESVEEKSVLVTRFDGEPAIDTGSGSKGESTLAINATSATSYTWTYSVNGQPRAQGRNVLAPDLKTFTEVSWKVTEPAKTKTFIYERQ